MNEHLVIQMVIEKTPLSTDFMKPLYKPGDMADDQLSLIQSFRKTLS